MGGLRTLSAAAVASALALPVTASADNVPVHLGIRSGGFSVQLQDAAAPAGTGAVRLRVVDARGTGAGWALRLEARGARVVVTSVRVACAAGSTCTLPRTRVAYPVALDASQPATVLDALSRTGMGALDVTLTVANASGRPAALSLTS